ncbi:MAG TPA: glycosyltransferase [Chthoniobacterales bacterium]
MTDPVSEKTPFVFLDPRGRRWPRLRRVAILGVALIFVAIVVFVQTLFLRPELALPGSVRHLKGQLKALQNTQPVPAATPAPSQSLRKFLQNHPLHGTKAVLPHPEKQTKEIRAGFYTVSGNYGMKSLESHSKLLTHVIPAWMSVADGNGTIDFDRDLPFVDLAQKNGLVVMPILNNLLDDTWQPDAVEAIATGPQERRDRFFAAIESELDAIGAGGVVVDWENLDPNYHEEMTKLLTQFSAVLRRKNKELWLMVSMSADAEIYDIDDLSPVVDRFVAMLVDENSDSDAPGPIASQEWVESCIKQISEDGDPSQWIAVLGTYGYDWAQGSKTGDQITFGDAMSRANYSGVEGVKVAPPTYNPGFSYFEGAVQHSVWFLDATTFLNQIQAVRKQKWAGIAIDHLGSEDSGIWRAVSAGQRTQASDFHKLTTLKTDDRLTNVGAGEVVSVDESQEPGERTIVQNANGYWTSEYKDFPTYPVLYHQGGNDPHKVTITFDDGPDPKWTPQILDILKQRGIHATFFLVGSQAEKYPWLVRRILAEGHCIGNHTYTHGNLGIMSDQQVRLELNATQRLIETITGRSTSLFRPPYNADSQPSTPEELSPLAIAEDLNYLIVLEAIDPEDWARPGTAEIVNRVRQQRHLGNIVLLHDAGGDRSQTVAALSQILDYLQERGDQIVSLDQLLNMSRDDLMPVLKQKKENFPLLVSRIGFETYRLVAGFLWSFMIVATVLVGLRTILVGILAARQKRRVQPENRDFHPPVSVVIAAYNEQKVIAGTLRSVLDTDYAGELEIVVINDGSKDDTLGAVREVMINEPRIRLIDQGNAGKSVALRNGIAAAKSEIIVFLDADTSFERETIRRLVAPLANPKVGAVSGHAKVGNLRSFIARCQSLEYICGFNLDRQAYAAWNCITVAPGAISAFRKRSIAEAGGISTGTLAEDTDITLQLHRARWEVAYAPGAVAWTEAPETFRTLAKQRFRWAFGTLQCLWKHRDLVFNPRYKALGLFSLPNIWFFQIFLVAITPLVDFYLLFSIYLGNGSTVLPYMAFFVFTDWALALVACRMEPEPLRKAFLVIPMRLIYRPLLSWVVWRSIYQALRGVIIGWGKLERTASVVVKRPINQP